MCAATSRKTRTKPVQLKTRAARWIGAALSVLALVSYAPLAQGQTLVGITGTSGDSAKYTVINDLGFISVGLSAADNLGTLSGSAGSLAAGTSVYLAAGGSYGLPPATVTGGIITQTVSGSGDFFLETTSGGIDILNADVSGAEIFGTQGSTSATVVLDLNTLSSPSSTLSVSDTPSAYLVLTGTTSIPLALSTQCLSAPTTCASSQLNLPPLTVDWQSATVTTTPPSLREKV